MKERFSNFESWTEVARTGNYLVKEWRDGELHYYAVKAAIGNWCYVVRNDHPMHVMLEGFVCGDVSGE